jgi:lysophospholipase L1-like esterase
MSPPLSLAVKLLLSLLSVCLTFGALEGGLRLYQRLAYDVPLAAGPGDLARAAEAGHGNRLSSIVLDEALGWRSTPNYRFRGTRSNSDGSAYPVSVSFDPDGFRTSGDPASARFKILAIGDSYTQAVEVSDGRGYYDLLREALGAEVFAYGAGGYATLQELMILDRYVDRIRPDLVLWQFCPNDFVDNVPDLEAASLYSNNGLRRPYLVDGWVEYISPKPDPLSARTFAQWHSRLASWALARWDLLQPQLAGETARGVEHAVAGEGADHPGFARSVRVTAELVGRAKRRVGPVPMVAFSCQGTQRYRDALEGITREWRVYFAGTVGEAVDRAAEAGGVVEVRDGHWNEAGHRLAGEQLLAYLRAVGLSSKPTP